MISVSSSSRLERREARRVIHRGVVVVDRTGTDDHEQAIVGAMQHAMDGLARLEGRRRRAIGCGKFAQQVRRRRKLGDFPNPRVVDGPGGAGHPLDGSLWAAGDGRGHGSGSWTFFQLKQYITVNWVGRSTLCHDPCCSAGWHGSNNCRRAVGEYVASRVRDAVDCLKTAGLSLQATIGGRNTSSIPTQDLSEFFHE